jgi:tetratricopeptide (TPR) repeat protein
MKSIKILFILVLSFVIQACGNSADQIKDYLESGKDFYNKENYIQAKLEFKNAIQIDNKLAEAYYYLALIDEKNKNWKGVYSNLSSTLQLNFDNHDARLMLAKIYLLSADLDKAKSEVNIVLNKVADNIDAIVLNGLILLKQGDPAAALAESEKALAINPAHVDSIGLQVAVYMAENDLKMALNKVEQALAINPDELSLYLLKLQVHQSSKNIAGMEQVHLDMVKRFPAKLNLSYELAKFYVSTQRETEALAVLKNIVEKNPTNIEPKLVLVDYFLLKDRQKAEAKLTQFIQENPEETGLYFRLANLYIKDKKFDQAKKALSWILNNKADEKDGLAAKAFLAKLALEDGDTATASQMNTEILAVDAKHYESLILKARILLIDNLYDEAITYLRGIVRDYPKSDEAMVLLAQAYFKKEAPELVEEFFRKALEVNPGNLTAVMPVVLGMIKNNDIARAEEVLNNALKSKPGHIGTLQMLAQIRLLKKDWAGTQKIVDLIAKEPGGGGYSNYLSGKISQGQKRYKQAINQYQLALAAKPKLTDALKNMLVCYNVLKQRPLMLGYLTEFIQKNPDLIYPLLLKSETYAIDKKWDEALMVLNSEIDKWAETVDIYEAIARIYSMKKEPQNVINTYKKGLEKLPDNVALRLPLATAYEAEHDYQAARENYEAILEKQPDLDIVVNNLASMLLDHMPSKENISKAAELTQKFKDSEQPYFEDTYGWAMLKEGNVEQALPIFEKIVRKIPDIAVFKYHLGVAYFQLKIYDKASSILNDTLDTGAKQKVFLEKDLTVKLLEEIQTFNNN